MNVVVIGRTGQVSRCLQQRLPDAEYLGRTELDLSDLDAVIPSLAARRPDFLINAAAYTAVDQAESDYDLALTVNGQAVEAMGRYCAQHSVPMVHISTDYVFPGSSSRPYLETDGTDPVNAYGRSKLAGEEALLATSGLNAVILRTSWVFSEFGNNFVKTMVRLAGERDALSVVDDQLGRPTYAGDIADTIVRIVERARNGQPLAAGLYHCASSGTTTWHDFAAEIFRQASAAGLIEREPLLTPISTAGFPTPAPRPAYSVLDTTKLDTALTWKPPEWHQGLRRTLEQL